MGVWLTFCGPMEAWLTFCGPMGVWLTFCGPIGAWLTFCGYLYVLQTRLIRTTVLLRTVTGIYSRKLYSHPWEVNTWNQTKQSNTRMTLTTTMHSFSISFSISDSITEYHSASFSCNRHGRLDIKCTSICNFLDVHAYCVKVMY